jgi:curved DNA-binding protein CbpA
MARDFYTVLAVPRNASEAQIRRRFRELARTRHPDRFHGAEKERAELDFQEITQAFNVLVDAERRRRHDLELVRPEEAGPSDARQLARAYLQRGIKAYREKNYLEAANNFDQAVKHDPQDARAWHHLAQACSQQKSWLPRAVAAIERACELAPMNPSYMKQAGRILALAGDAERAVYFYRKSIQWGEDDPAVRQALEELGRAAGSSRRGLFGKTG